MIESERLEISSRKLGGKKKKKKICNIFTMQGNITSKDGHDKGQKQ